mmetsp:Transcript_37840/g.117997  ORF Transcript_37840/g.117997 Transcript_37840/m.117997 type:complete len:221 (-) Transcript_37840:285-947(-)
MGCFGRRQVAGSRSGASRRWRGAYAVKFPWACTSALAGAATIPLGPQGHHLPVCHVRGGAVREGRRRHRGGAPRAGRRAGERAGGALGARGGDGRRGGARAATWRCGAAVAPPVHLLPAIAALRRLDVGAGRLRAVARRRAVRAHAAARGAGASRPARSHARSLALQHMQHGPGPVAPGRLRLGGAGAHTGGHGGAADTPGAGVVRRARPGQADGTVARV